MVNAILERFVRAGIATILPAVLAIYSGNPWLQAATPLLMMIAKALRNKYPENPWIRLIPF